MRTESYLSDQELNELISDAEQKDVLTPPAYLEQEILDKISCLPKQAESTAGKVRAKSGSRLSPAAAHKELLLYSVKIMAAAAAAIVMIFTIPAAQWETVQQTAPYTASEVQNQKDKEEQEAEKITDRLGEAADSFYEHLNSFTEGIISDRRYTDTMKEDSK